MNWKAIGKSVIGISHVQIQKQCEDSVAFEIVVTNNSEEVLICCVSDGAGSAKNALEASMFVTSKTVGLLTQWVSEEKEIKKDSLHLLSEHLYDELLSFASEKKVNLNEFSCTFLGCIIYSQKAIFFQIGDGVLIREDGANNYVHVWWPENGEYSNTTTFLIDDPQFSNLKILVLEEAIEEIAIITDGLQFLVLNNETFSVHQPFFSNLFKWLRLASKEEDVVVLNNKLSEYLSSDIINSRTDDDKTLFLATRINNA